jgi:hypothetical protein
MRAATLTWRSRSGLSFGTPLRITRKSQKALHEGRAGPDLRGASGRSCGRKRADGTGAALGLAIEALGRLGEVEPGSVVLGKSHVGEDVAFGLVHHRGELRRLGLELIRDHFRHLDPETVATTTLPYGASCWRPWASRDNSETPGFAGWFRAREVPRLRPGRPSGGAFRAARPKVSGRNQRTRARGSRGRCACR